MLTDDRDGKKLPSWAPDERTYARYQEIVANVMSHPDFSGLGCGWSRGRGEMIATKKDGQSITVTGITPMDAAELMDKIIDALLLAELQP